MAVSSYDTADIRNQVDIIDLRFGEEEQGFQKINEFEHEYPPTKVMWMPDVSSSTKELIATSAEFIRIWELDPEDNTYKDHKITENVSELNFE